eukprot:1744497-Prymnesium_polylepis.1
MGLADLSRRGRSKRDSGAPQTRRKSHVLPLAVGGADTGRFGSGQTVLARSFGMGCRTCARWRPPSKQRNRCGKYRRAACTNQPDDSCWVPGG